MPERSLPETLTITRPVTDTIVALIVVIMIQVLGLLAGSDNSVGSESGNVLYHLITDNGNVIFLLPCALLLRDFSTKLAAWRYQTETLRLGVKPGELATLCENQDVNIAFLIAKYNRASLLFVLLLLIKNR